jgi:DNA-binding XRE family transcriptional regulator
MTLKASELRARRAVERLTQKDFAKKIGISRQFLNQLENEEVNVTERIEQLYDAVYNGERLITIVKSERAVVCPNYDCHTECTPQLVELKDVPQDSLDNVYECPDCHWRFSGRTAFAVIQSHRDQGDKRK